MFSSISCEDVNDSQIPDVPFSFTINLNHYNDLTIPGNSRLFPFGFGGVIVTCDPSGTHYAYDAACTFEAKQSCKVKNNGLTGICECCGSEYLLIYEAYPSSGPAPAPLKQYQVANVNSFTIRVYN